jgi:chitin disaccharide deacetylase
MRRRGAVRLIINADDLGRSREVNDTIAELFAAGLITSATVMANAPFLEDALRKIPGAFRRSLGVHLNITEFRPLTAHPGWQGWVDEQGCFSLAAFRQRPLTSMLKEAIGAEWTAQINRVRAYGLEVSHLDSHHDVHTDIRLFGVLKRLQYRLRLRKIRLAENLRTSQSGYFLKNKVWNWAVRYCPPAAVTTAGFASFSTFLETARQGRLPYSSLEVMVHPGHPRFSEESGWLKEAWREVLAFPVELISYGDL